MILAAPEHQEMNRQVKVTKRTLLTIAHSIMVHARISKAYINFALIYTTDHIFPVLPIRDLINKYGKPTTRKCDTEGFVPVASLNGVVGSPSLFIRSLIGRNGKI